MVGLCFACFISFKVGRGGVSLPVVIPVKETLEPDGVSDDRQRIQNAINRAKK